ncbi:MAG: mechanosensitive ion channel family protein [Acidobacteria bacterium]|nr:mechanosensitive ion channel family protein [Acidobacteriota bacterium]
MIGMESFAGSLIGSPLAVSNMERWLSLFGTNRHIQALVVALASILLAKIVSWLLIRGLSPLARRTAAEFDDQVVSLLHGPTFTTVLLAGVGVALQLDRPPAPFDFILFGLIKTIVVVAWFVFGIRVSVLLLTWVSHHPKRFSAVQPSTRPLFEIAAKVILFGAAVYFVLIAWEVNPTGWVASAGIIGIAVGFAAKDTLANLFAGVSILADAPYKVGDFIVLDGDRGQVTQIGLRSTRILTRDDIEITIPNSTIANTKIVNESGGPWIAHRLRIPVGVAYGSDVDRVRRVLEEVAGANEHICREPVPRVRFRGFGDSSLNFELLCWIENASTRGLAQDSLNTAVYKALVKAEIEIPFPKRDVYIRQMPELRQ